MDQPPLGFYSANELINSWPLDVVREISLCVLHADIIDSDRYASLLGVSVHLVHHAVNALFFIFRSSIRFSYPSLKDLLSRYSVLDSKYIDILEDVWQNRLQKTIGSVALCKLVGIDWKLGVGISSNSCKTLASPFITMKIKTLSSDGNFDAQCFELSMAQFKQFYDSFQNIAASIDSA